MIALLRGLQQAEICESPSTCTPERKARCTAMGPEAWPKVGKDMETRRHSAIFLSSFYVDLARLITNDTDVHWRYRIHHGQLLEEFTTATMDEIQTQDPERDLVHPRSTGGWRQLPCNSSGLGRKEGCQAAPHLRHRSRGWAGWAKLTRSTTK